MNTRKLSALVVALAAGLPLLFAPARAERVKTDAGDQKSVSITIYNTDLGLVKDVRDIRLPRGTHELWFEGVAASIDPTSVHIRSLDAPASLSVLEQNFEYDLISPARLMEKYVGMDVELVQIREEKERVVRAKLLGTTNGYVYEIDRKIAVNPDGRVVLPALPEGLISKPSLVWLLDNRRDRHTVEASYLTGGINWKANYVAVLSADDTETDLAGWVTIDNKSGATYTDATLKLVAGDVNRVQPERELRRMAAMTPADAAAPQFEEESFFEYHLYTLGRPATVKDNQTKQLSLLSAEDIGVEKSFVYSGQSFWNRQYAEVDRRSKVQVFVAFDNTEGNRMGMPLPRGVVRVYKKDNDGALQFIGEDEIDHTPKGETVRIKMGNAFDVVAERVQTDFERVSNRVFRSSYKVTIRNHKDDDITVQVIEHLSGDWEITRRSHEFEKESSHRIRFDVPVTADGSTELTYTAIVRY